MVDWQGKKNPLLELAEDISLTPRKKTPEEEELDEMRGEMVAEDWHNDPRLQKDGRVAADPINGIEAANPPGSFEALMAGWGSPVRRGFHVDLEDGGSEPEEA